VCDVGLKPIAQVRISAAWEKRTVDVERNVGAEGKEAPGEDD
jgi:hypothetical protein